MRPRRGRRRRLAAAGGLGLGGQHQLGGRGQEQEQQGEHHRGGGQVPQPQPHPGLAGVQQRHQHPGDQGDADQHGAAQVGQLLGHLDGQQGEQPEHGGQVQKAPDRGRDQPDHDLQGPDAKGREQDHPQDEQDDVEPVGPAEQEEVRALAGHLQQRLGDGKAAEHEQLHQRPQLEPVSPRRLVVVAGHQRPLSSR
jgi:hypothetical protein